MAAADASPPVITHQLTDQQQQDQAATAIQAAIRSRAARKTTQGQAASERAEARRKEREEKAAAAAAAAEAERLTERQRIAEEKYAEADVDGDESVSKDELATLIQQMLVEQGIELDPEVVKQFVIEQFEEADADDDGTVSFEEFCVYYNSLIDRLEGEQRSAVMRGLREREAEVSAERMRQDAAQLAADDLADMEALMKLIAVLTDESVAPVSGTQLLFERGEAGVRPVASPSEEAYHTTRGIVLDLNQYGQRLITPWGSYIISYTLTFEGYNEESARAAAEEAALLRMNTESFYFVLCRISSPLLHFKKLPERTHFALTSVLNTAVAVGEVVDDAAAQRDEAWHAERVARFEAARDAAALPEPPPGKFLVNAVLGRTVVVDKSLIEPLESRLKKSKTKQRPEVVETALLLTGNDLEAAHKLRSEHLKDVDKLVSARKGYSTRDHCDEVLASCRWDYERALFVLENEAIAEATVNEIMKKRGLETGLGFPSRDEVKWEVALAKNEQASAIRSIVRQWTIEVRMMREIVKYAPVDRLAQRDAELEHPGRKHIEQLLERHGGDADYVEHLLSDTAFILKERKSLGNPSRERVEELVRHFDFDEHKVKAYLKSVEYIYKSRRQVGSPSRAEIEHYLDKFKYDQKKAIKYMKFVFKFIDPKQPRELAAAPRKIEGRLITHIAHNCELLLKGTPQPWARHSVEVALDATDSVEDEAIAFLIKVAKMHKDCPHLPRWELEYASARSYVLDRDDGKVTLDETMKQWKRFDQYVSSLRDVGAPDRLRVRDMLETLDFDEEATRARFAAIHEVSKTNDKAELGLGKDEIEKNLAKYDWDPEPTKKYLLGMHSLRSRAAQCGNPPLSTIEAALRRHELDAEMAYRHLWAVGQVKSDKEFLADASQPSAADIDRAMALVSYDVDKARKILLTVSELVRDCERYGGPDREHVEAVFIEAGLDRKAALSQLKAEHRSGEVERIREAQAERRAKKAEEEKYQRIVLADDPKEKERLEAEARAREAAEAAARRVAAEEAERKAAEAREAEKQRQKEEEEARRQRLVASIDTGPKMKTKRSNSKSEDAGPEKTVEELNAERLARIAAITGQASDEQRSAQI